MRYVKLYFTCLKRSLISRLEYKKDTFIGILSFFISNIASILSIYFIINSILSLIQLDVKKQTNALRTFNNTSFTPR